MSTVLDWIATITSVVAAVFGVWNLVYARHLDKREKKRERADASDA